MPYYSGHATDVVGYAHEADEFCPRCTLERLGVVTTGPVRPGATLESEIETYVVENGLQIHREDSNVVPQPIFNGEDAFEEDSSPRHCGRCHEPLVES